MKLISFIINLKDQSMDKVVEPMQENQNAQISMKLMMKKMLILIKAE